MQDVLGNETLVTGGNTQKENNAIFLIYKGDIYLSQTNFKWLGNIQNHALCSCQWIWITFSDYGRVIFFPFSFSLFFILPSHQMTYVSYPSFVLNLN